MAKTLYGWDKRIPTTQLWHHIYCGGGLCELPTWEPAVALAR